MASPRIWFFPPTPMSDQDKISPHIINTTSSRRVMRIKKILIRGLLADNILNSLKQHLKNCMADCIENY